MEHGHDFDWLDFQRIVMGFIQKRTWRGKEGRRDGGENEEEDTELEAEEKGLVEEVEEEEGWM